MMLSFPAYSSVSVAFLEIRKWNGEIKELEPGFKYSHVALQTEGGWLHAHPVRGVEIISDELLEKVGKIRKVLRREDISLSEHSLQQFLGKPYDSEFSWTDEKIYCAELVGKLIDLEPTPMHFDPALWPAHFLQFEGELGTSPKKIHDFMLQIRGPKPRLDS
jgi:hypothetical protein